MPLLKSIIILGNIGIDHFQVLKKIGSGGFSTVYLGIYFTDLARKKDTA